MYIFYQLLLLLPICNLIKGKQHWAEQPSSVSVNPGSSAVLACRIQNLGGECRWERRVDGGGSVPVGIYPGKYEWAGSTGTGDCSLRIKEAEFHYDNGRWVCQVTASGFRETDTLISREATVTVRAPPKSVVLQKPGDASVLQAPLIGVAGEDISIKCIAKGGNPPPTLHWYLDNTEIDGGVESEDEAEKTVTSVINIPVRKEDGKRRLCCVVEHEALDTELQADTELDIHFAPEVSLKPGEASISAQEDSTVNITCQTEGNPVPEIVWKNAGTGDILSTSGLLSLPNISKDQAGAYLCQARNSVGASRDIQAVIDVQYGARVLSVSPRWMTVPKLYGETVELVCEGDGNPLPWYEWVQHTHTGQAVTRGHEAVLAIAGLEYQDQGEYQCRVSNSIASSDSEGVVLTLQGPPRITSDSNKPIALIEGRDATLEVEFCGFPVPKQTWMIESLEKKVTLVAGTSHDKYRVEKERKSELNNCFISALHILSTDQFDTKDYILKLENEHGVEIHKAHVTFGEELSKETIIGSVVGVLVMALLLLCLALICCCRKCCKSEKKMKQDPERNL